MRKAAALFLTAVLLLAAVVNADAYTIVYDGKVEDYPWAPIVLVVDGQAVETPQMAPIILNGRTLVPAREFFEQLGATVTWEQASMRVIIEYNGERIIMTINSRTVYIGDNSVIIPKADPAPKIVNDKTMIPVRFVAEEFGFDVQWKNDTRSVIITSPEASNVGLSMINLSTQGNQDTVFVAMDEFVNPNVFMMESPKRVVIDLYGTTASIADGSIQQEGSCVEKIRYSQHDDKFRIVADLKAEADFEVFKLRNGVEVSIIKTGDIVEDSTEIPEEEVTEVIEIDENATIPNTDGRYVVVVDAGHGGADPGATYPVGVKNPDISEKDITLDISLMVTERLRNAGVEVLLTRSADVYPTLKERVDFANNSNADLYVSVHCNAMDNKDEIDGAQVYYHEKSPFGKKMAKYVYENIIDHTKMTRRGVVNGSAFYVLKNTKMPAILIENGFITNEKDRNYLSAESGRVALADAISEGILEALGIK